MTSVIPTFATHIISNGSKWGGEAPDSVDTLLAVLRGSAILDPRFEEYGNFITVTNGGSHFFGNFLTVSHVFNINSNDPEVVGPLTEAIRDNQARPEYQAARPQRDPRVGDWATPKGDDGADPLYVTRVQKRGSGYSIWLAAGSGELGPYPARTYTFTPNGART